jgi:hypothetical protein
MPGITIKINGRDTLVTDIKPYKTDRDQVLAKLTAIYAVFDEARADALGPREAEIVELVNRFNMLEHIIETFDSASARHANILAGWAVVKQNRSEDGA